MLARVVTCIEAEEMNKWYSIDTISCSEEPLASQRMLDTKILEGFVVS
jgi:hypothetical protein